MTSGLIRITYTKSSIGYARRQKETVRSLGLRRLGDVVVQADSPAVRGMVRAVAHLVTVEPVADATVTEASVTVDDAAAAARSAAVAEPAAAPETATEAAADKPAGKPVRRATRARPARQEGSVSP